MLSGESYYPRHAAISEHFTVPTDYRPAYKLREPIANALIGYAADVEAFDPSDYERPPRRIERTEINGRCFL